MDYFVPAIIKGTTPSGKPFRFFRGIHAIPDDLANHADANKLGIIPVEEMGDEDWRALALDKAKWMAANRPQPVPEPVPVPVAVPTEVESASEPQADAPVEARHDA